MPTIYRKTGKRAKQIKKKMSEIRQRQLTRSGRTNLHVIEMASVTAALTPHKHTTHALLAGERTRTGRMNSESQQTETVAETDQMAHLVMTLLQLEQSKPTF
jgi:hypothetical protein